MSTASRAEVADFIDDRRIEETLAAARPDAGRVREVLAKSLAKKRLEPDEAAALLAIKDPELWQEVFAAARKLKTDVYGNRIVLFAPLYVGDKCINNCAYCGFKCSNRDVVRKTLSDEELRSELVALEGQGHKRLILVWGEHPNYSAEEMARIVKIAYATKAGRGEIRRVNINAAPLDVDGYRTMKAAGIGTYQVLQETYHHPTYAAVHPANTRKGDYLWRLTAHDRAMAGGVDDVGIGALFGLYDWRFEVMGLLTHTIHLEERWGVGPHTISFPRINVASNVELDRTHFVCDEDFKKVIAVLRLAVPYTGMILTARETPEMRREGLRLGVSQIDAGSRIELGAYQECRGEDCQQLEREQFELHDTRPLDAVVGELVRDGYMPSWCTSCYRLGRTGEHFMEFSIPGFIKRYCTPNSLTTLAEYLTDYASEETKRDGFALIEKEAAQIPDEKKRNTVRERIEKIRTTNERDLCF
ncbi:[FeFe] hydrogenase H-cluster radical SAM maturase HydG [candidate division WOR-3 bacterium]|uniref:[FeFe] hydrogenase H-cluster radical SAM maturase HydG n=1 Tax=candidate division WOR-3 bacterium TaxID=2052148 RepID=A0A937XHF4_UNCW3|nr:[FeFe] hydrogenase H-cluster radical SAM maturase HydG [candidate division WOR-3 bacterium]